MSADRTTMSTEKGASMVAPTAVTEDVGDDPGRRSSGAGPHRSPRALERIWADRRLAVGTVVLIAAIGGVLAGVSTPRGPLTSAAALATMAGALVVGTLSGVALRSRWAMLLAPVVAVAVVELVRVGTIGPTVDAPRPSTYGLLALAVGRGVHGLFGLAPMVVGVALGIGAARRLESRWSAGDEVPAASRAGRVLLGLGLVLLVALAGFTARPATTAAIEGADGDPLPGSISELTTVQHGDHEYGLMLRGVDRDAPVVLFLAGGPGGSERGAMRNHLSALEDHFVVATWDQRGTGTSYRELDPTSTLTLESQVDDTIAVTNHLRERFGTDRIYLLGQSWGSTLGVLAVQEAPELYRAFVGTGQMVSQRETDTLFHRDTLEWAEAQGNTALAERLRDIGPPPYESMLDYETALSYEHQVYPYDRSPNSEGQGGFSENFIVPEYTLVDQLHLLGGFMDTFSVLYPQLQDIDFRRTATRLEVPVFFVQGAHEAGGRAEPFADWYERLDAPVKDLAVFETSGHRPLFEQPDEFVDHMTGVVLARTSDEGPGR